MRKLRACAWVVAAACGLNWVEASAADCVGEAAASARADDDRALEAYRAGRVTDSLPPMRAAHTRCPDDAAYRNDFIAISVAAGHADDALAAGEALDPSALPGYVVVALARAARDLHRPSEALRYYDVVLGRGPDVSVRVGRDLALIDSGRAREALADLSLIAPEEPRIDVLEASGLAHEALGEVIAALAAAEALLRIDPDHAGALKLRFRMLLRSGAPQLALDLTPAGLISRSEHDTALQSALALELRWARTAPDTALAEAGKLDAVIGRLRAAIADPAVGPEGRFRLRCDLVEALADRGRNGAAVREYEGLTAADMPVPAYVVAAAAAAYLAQRQPQRALELYRRLPIDLGASFGPRTTQVYALLESGRLRAAATRADALAAAQSRFVDADSPELRTHNDDYVSAKVLAALVRAYTDRPEEALLRLRSLLAVAPGNTEARLALAETEAIRGWPRLSVAAANDAAVADPTSTGSLARVFDAQMQMGDYRSAAQTRSRMESSLPAEAGALVKAEHDWRIHEMAVATIDGQLGRSYGGRAGVVDSAVEEYAYSAPLAYDYRAYVHLNQTEGTPVQGDTFRHAVGAGIEYHTRQWLATAEVLEIDHRSAAPQLRIEATPNDFWTFGAAFALRTLEIPIAAVVVGVHANRAQLAMEFRASEARDLEATVSHEAFSDGNSRYDASAMWRERWITGAIFKLDTRIDVDASRNTTGETNYFNPQRDFTGVFTIENQWLQFRRYDRALMHEIDLGVGDYAQRAHAAGLVELVRYQIVYEISDRVRLKGGFGRTVRPYDGARERLDALNFGLLGRF